MGKAFIVKNLTKICLCLAVLFFVIAAITLVFAKTPQVKKILTQTIIHQVTLTPTPLPTSGQAMAAPAGSSITTTVTPITAASVTSQPTPTQTAQSQQQTLSVSLSINGSSIGQISVASGANQCDVLQNALSQGKIQSLNMRYDNSLGTYGVYQINGQGKDNAIWWTYKVNGQSPTSGCSYIKANNGDSIDWSYVGS